MKGRGAKRQKRRILALSEKWRVATGLGSWRGRHSFNHDRASFKCPDVPGGEVLMRCYCDWRYEQVMIEVNIEWLSCFSNNELEEFYLHELAHVFLNEVREEGIHHEEHAATLLGKAFMWIRQAGKRDARRKRAARRVAPA